MANLSPAASVVRPSLLHLKVWKTSSIGTFSYNKYKFHYKLKSKTKSMTPERSKTPKTEHSNTKKNLCEVRIRRKHRKKKKYNPATKSTNRVHIHHQPTRNQKPRKEKALKKKNTKAKTPKKAKIILRTVEKMGQIGCSVVLPNPQLLLAQPPNLLPCYPSQTSRFYWCISKWKQISKEHKTPARNQWQNRALSVIPQWSTLALFVC